MRAGPHGSLSFVDQFDSFEAAKTLHVGGEIAVTGHPVQTVRPILPEFLRIPIRSQGRASFSLPRQTLHVLPPQVKLNVKLEKNLGPQFKQADHEPGFIRFVVQRSIEL